MIDMHRRSGRPPAESMREERFQSLFDRFAGDVFAYARRRVSAMDADDVVAETFAVVWRRVDDVPTNPRPWLLGVARNCLANRHRGERRRVALVDRLSTATQVDEPSDSVQQPLSDPVRVAFEAVPANARELLALLAWEGLTPHEAAQVLDCTHAALYLRLHRARRRFARELERATERQE